MTDIMQEVLEGRVPPQNPEIEQSVLGAVMLAPDRLSEVREIIGPESFYLDQHGIIFEAFITLNERGLKPDLAAVLNELKQKNLLDKVGGAGYVAALLSASPTAAHVDHHSHIVSELYTMRTLINTCTRIIEMAYKQDDSPENILEFAEQTVLGVSKAGKTAGYSLLGQVLMGLMEGITKTYTHRQEHPDEPYFAGEPTQFRDIDKLLGGFHPGSLNILASRPGVGKTSLALNIATNIARNQREGLPVLVFSLEMPNQLLALRILSSESRYAIKAIQSADEEIANEDWHRLTRAVRSLTDLKILMNDASSLTVRQVANTLRRVRSKYGDVALVIIDYLQLMDSGVKAENRVQEVSYISRMLKSLALKEMVPILACSQLSRQVEHRKEQRPVLADLRESGSIEQDADVVMFLYNLRAGDDTPPPANTPEHSDYLRQVSGRKKTDDIRCYIAKNRNGPTGECPLKFFKEFCKFETGSFEDGKRRRRKDKRGAE